MATTVRVDLSPLKRDFKRFPRSSQGRRTLKQWGAIYRGFVYRRYDRASKGDGTWKPLAPSTVKRRRKRSKSILRDTGLLYRALQPTFPGPGSFEKQGWKKITVGYGSQARHGRSSVTIADIASFHQFGGPNLPKREIIVDPDEETLKQMARVLEKNITQFLK